MTADDPIVLLRRLDPAEAKDVDAVVGRLAAAGMPIPAQAPHRRRRGRTHRRVGWLVVACASAGVMLAALVANPFARNGAISSAQAKAQVARALDLAGGWHITRSSQFGGEGSGFPTPRWSKPQTDDIWHAPDGRLAITSTGAEGDSSTVLYAGGERRSYDSRSNTLTIHRFVLAADLRDDLRSYLPPSAADLYRTAYRVGKVRLAGIETISGRRVYRLAFDWLGSSYTLIFDAARQVPLLSETRTPNGRAGVNGPKRYFYTRVRYTAYERVQPGAALDRKLALPASAASADVVRERPIVVPAPARGASAVVLVTAIAARHLTLGADSLPARATYALVARVPGGGIAALARIPSRNPAMTCSAFAEIARPGGEARVGSVSCSSGTGFATSRSHDGRYTIVVGTVRHARALTLRSANGAVVHAQIDGRLILAIAPVAFFQRKVTMISTKTDGTTARQAWPVFAPMGDFASTAGN